jgi:foldase protein PrsA
MEKWRTSMSQESFESQCRGVIEMKLRELINFRLVVQEAKNKLSDQEKAEIDGALGNTVKNLASEAGSALALEERLKGQGATVEEEKTRERERMMVQRYLREKVAPEVHVTHGELLAYYNQVRAERYEQPDRVRMGLIMLKKSASASEEQARALAKAVHERAANGEDFARLAQRYSRDAMGEKGGDWGLVTRGSFRIKAVDDALFSLQAGQVGPVVETEDSFYIVKAIECQSARTVPFTEVQAQIEEEIRDKKYNEQVSKYIRELYDRSYVHVMLENL